MVHCAYVCLSVRARPEKRNTYSTPCLERFYSILTSNFAKMLIDLQNSFKAALQ